MPQLDREWFARDAREVAVDLLGCMLVRRFPDGTEAAVRIVETEAYRGSDDPASHAGRRRTARNDPMFGQPGNLYVYFTYGMHYCMNIVCEPAGQPAAVLIRGAVPVRGEEHLRARRPGVPDRQLLNGPAKLTKALELDLKFNRYDLLAADGEPDAACGGKALSILPAESPPGSWKATPRIGISAGTDLLWRYVVEQIL
jgi:DNA-3-methyladenine glycosylase